jgi:hypothetical protein
MRWTTRLAILLTVLLGPAGCALDREATLRAELSAWLFLSQTRYFASSHGCTAAVFDLVSPALKSAAPPAVTSLDAALARIGRGRPVRFSAAARSPNALSEALMTRDLHAGLGLLSAGVRPARACMADWVARGYQRVLRSPKAVTIYDAGGNALLLVYPPERLAFFLRGSP